MPKVHRQYTRKDKTSIYDLTRKNLKNTWLLEKKIEILKVLSETLENS